MRPKKLVKSQLGSSWKVREQRPPAVNTAVANRRTSRTTKFTTNIKTCSHCGKRGHGKNFPAKTTENDFPTYGKTCAHCRRPNHLKAVCRSKTKPDPKLPPSPNATSGYTENAVFDALCTATSFSKTRDGYMIHLDHHLYNHLKDRWIRQSSKPHPFLTLTVTAHPEDYTALGYNPINPQPKNNHYLCHGRYRLPELLGWH